MLRLQGVQGLANSAQRPPAASSERVAYITHSGFDKPVCFIASWGQVVPL